MNVPRKLIGAEVRLTWKDPTAGRGPIHGMLEGKDALATWTEYGKIWSIKDGVVILARGIGTSPSEEKPDELERTAVQETVIEELVVLVPQGEPLGEGV